MHFPKSKITTVLQLSILIIYSVSNAQIVTDSMQVSEVNLDTLALQPKQLDRIPKKNSIWQNLKYDGLTAFGAIKHAYSRPLH